MMQAASNTGSVDFQLTVRRYIPEDRTIRNPAVRTSDPMDIQKFDRKYKDTFTVKAKTHFEFCLVFDKIDKYWVII
jgi:hypothetical protein